MLTGARRALAVLAAAAGLAAAPALAQESSTQPNFLPQPRQAEGVPVEQVLVRRAKGSGDAARDEAALAAVRRIASPLAGQPFSMIETMRLIRVMERDAAVARVAYRLLPAGFNSIRLEFLVDAAPRPKTEALPKGVLAGNLGDFPVIYQDDRSLVTAIVAGGLGVYSDNNPWFGQPELFNQFNPLAGHLPGKSATWTEGSVELGGGFAAQIGNRPLYGFGALTGMKTWSVGQDIFRDDTRDFDAIEKAYAGLLYVNADSKDSLKISAGRQTLTINDGFLVNLVKGSSNAGERGATYLGPRLSNDFSVLAGGRYGPWNFQAFYIDPDEIESLETDSTFLGANLRYTFNADVSFDGTFITIPTSKTSYASPYGLSLEKQGVDTVSAHLLWKNLLRPGIWAESEIAHQFKLEDDMSAWAGYGTLGYIARDMAWTPSISYRYAYFSGDDPDTRTYERFDPLLSTGLGIWLQGISFGKLTANSNLATQRVQINVAPMETLNVTFDYHKLRAPQTNNAGANPALAQLVSHDLGQEFTLSARWAINRNLYLQSVASYALPGEALRGIGADENWSTLQLSLYWSL